MLCSVLKMKMIGMKMNDTKIEMKGVYMKVEAKYHTNFIFLNSSTSY